MKKKRIIIGLICIVALWVVTGVVDFVLVHNYHKPLFCVGIDLADDGGSGKYVGLGYSFDLEGGFMPDDNEPDVTSYRGYIFGQEVSRGFWDNMLVSKDNEDKLIYGEPQEPSNNDIIYGEGECLELPDIESISKTRAEEIALEQCKVNYDYIKTEFNPTEKQWSVEFWNADRKIPTQTILIDTEGKITNVIDCK